MVAKRSTLFLSMIMAASLQVAVMPCAAAVFFSEIGGAQQIWVTVDHFSAQSMADGSPNFVEDASDALTALSNHARYFPLPGDEASWAEDQLDWWAHYEIPAADVPAGFNIPGPWYFFARTQRPPQTHQFNRQIDSDWLLVNGDPNDLNISGATNADWLSAAETSAATQPPEDIILNGVADAGGTNTWIWIGQTQSLTSGVPKQLSFVDDKLSFRIYEREAHALNSRIDVMVFSSSDTYVPSDADFLSAACSNPTIFDPAPVSPAVVNKPAGVVQLTITGAEVGSIDTIALVQPANDTWSNKDTTEHSLPEVVIPGTIIEVVSSSEIVAEFDLYNQRIGTYNLRATRSDGCNPVTPVTDAFELTLPLGANLLVNGDFESGTFDHWDVTGDVEIAQEGYFGGADPHGGTYFAGLVHDGTELDENLEPVPPKEATLEQSVGLPYGPGQYDLTLVSWIRLHDVLYDPTWVMAEVLADGESVSSQTIALSGWIDLEHLQYTPMIVDFSGMAIQDITVRLTLYADGKDGWGDRRLGVVGVDDVQLLSSSGPCNDPFADIDGDGDVDQEDFGLWQLCYSGTDVPYPSSLPHCRCQDRPVGGELDGDVDAQDYTAFEACASGPDIPAPIACDD